MGIVAKACWRSTLRLGWRRASGRQVCLRARPVIEGYAAQIASISGAGTVGIPDWRD